MGVDSWCIDEQHRVEDHTGIWAIPSGTWAILTRIATNSPSGDCNHPCNISAGTSGLTVSIAATLTHLLLYNMQGDNTVEGVYVGDGRPPIPAKLAQKIRLWEFIDMGELLPEFSQSNDEACSSKTAKNPRQVTNIFSWMQCFYDVCQYLGTGLSRSDPKTDGLRSNYY